MELIYVGSNPTPSIGKCRIEILRQIWTGSLAYSSLIKNTKTSIRLSSLTVIQMDADVFEVEEVSLGDKIAGDKIIFKSIDDMERAYKAIDNGRNVYLKTEDGLVTKILNQMITNRIYDGNIKLSARIKKGEKIEETE